MGSIVWKALAAGSTVIATLVAGRVAEQIWKSTGQDDVNPEDPEAPVLQAVAYAALTGLLVAGLKTFATRKAAQYYENSAGHLPKGVLPKS